MKFLTLIKWYWVTAVCLIISLNAFSQTDFDGIMMTKNNLCSGAMYSHSSWTNYWEGTNKRDNANLGRVSNNMYAVMANYGITDNLNIIAGLPYVTTKATAGTLHPMKGLQDISLWIKWEAIEKHIGNRQHKQHGSKKPKSCTMPFSFHFPDSQKVNDSQANKKA